MAITKGKIGNALTSTAADHVVAVAADIYDEDKEKYQSAINSETDEELAQIARNVGAYSESFSLSTSTWKKAMDISIAKDSTFCINVKSSALMSRIILAYNVQASSSYYLKNEYINEESVTYDFIAPADITSLYIYIVTSEDATVNFILLENISYDIDCLKPVVDNLGVRVTTIQDNISILTDDVNEVKNVTSKIARISYNIANPSNIAEKTVLNNISAGEVYTTKGSDYYHTISGIEVKKGKTYSIGQKCRLYCIVDSDGKVLENGYDAHTEPFTITPEHDGILIFSFYTDGYPYNIWVSDASKTTSYEEYGVVIYTDEFDNKVNGMIDNDFEVSINSQLFDRSKIIVGYINASGYEGSSATGYVHSQKIDVSSYTGKTIYFSIDGIAPRSGYSFRFITAYDATGAVVEASGVNSDSLNINTYTIPTGISSIVISYTNPDSESTMAMFQAELDKITPFNDYGTKRILKYEYVEDNVDASIAENEASTNVLYGKKWVSCGDSFTHGDFTNSPTENYTIESGLYKGQLKVYPFLIGNRNSMEIINEAVNGSTMTYLDGTISEFSTADGRYTKIASDADYITLKFGINDDSDHKGATIGTIDDTSNTTFYGAWNIVMNYIITNHPQAKIGIIITNGSTLPIVNATIAIAKKWGIPYLNEATDEQCSFMFRSLRTDVVESIRTLKDNQWYVESSTNRHPNEKAHEYESTVIENWLRSL